MKIKQFSRGNILDIGGGDFYKTFLKLNVSFDSYTVIDKKDRIIRQSP
ncbi:MAG: hypothetical protein N2746_09655 [Deltaproteobacteria bacterium]|nr:hypothetical protein [Deltaproteobacteria bacterium]